MKSEGKVGIYIHRPAELVPYDVDYPSVAAQIANIIKRELSFITVEHVGSTAVSNCDGKGIIDLMVLYPKGSLGIIKKTLHSLGFQPQPHKDPFPGYRPMLVGSMLYNQKEFQIHLHVIQQGCSEAYSLIEFRERLRNDINLRKQYHRCKKQILRRGIIDSLEYSKAKQSFIKNVLAEGFK